MSPVIPQYTSPPAIHSVLFDHPPDAVPPTEELEALHAELNFLKQKTLERAKKAGEDLKTIEESMRRLKEKEKGKAKAIEKEKEKVKRERGFTPLSNGDEPALSIQPPPPQKRPRIPSVSVHSIPSTPTPAPDPRKSSREEVKKKNHKRKREELSDGEPGRLTARPKGLLFTNFYFRTREEQESFASARAHPPTYPVTSSSEGGEVSITVARFQ